MFAGSGVVTVDFQKLGGATPDDTSFFITAFC
jgi:hypothetical protein